MNHRLATLAIFAGAAIAAPAFAQDSVSINVGGGNGLPGDALSPWNTAHQCASYRVTLTPFTTSRGDAFVIGPIVKGSRTEANFFNSLMSAQAMSKTLRTGVAYPSGSYASWTTAGPGVHPVDNSAPGSTTPGGSSTQFGVAFAEFGGTANVVTGALVNFDPSDATNLFVKRVTAAVNTTAQQTPDFSQFGVGSVDSDGNATFRADSNGSTGLPAGNRLVGNNIFRVDMGARNCGAINFIDNNGATDAGATGWILQRSAVVHSVPNMLPESIGSRPVYVGGNFSIQHVYESAPLVTSATGAHLSGTDQRGATAVSTRAIYAPGSVATLGSLMKSVAGGGNTDTLGLWGVDANGAVVGAPKALVHPGSVTDPADPYLSAPSGVDIFDHYHGSTAFRGGASQVAIGRDQAGRVLTAATTYEFGGNTDPFNNIAVARFDPAAAGQPVTWTLAAWIDFIPGAWPQGKPIFDGSGVQIGELTCLFQVTNGSPTGPSISAPAFDSAGNVYFLAACQFYVGADDDALPLGAGTPRPVGGDDIYTNALIRGVYNPVNAGYKLEVVFRNRQVFTSASTGLNYQIQFLDISGNSTVSPGTFWSGNAVEQPFGNADNSGYAVNDPRNLGGLIVSADICYDVDGDGDFNDPSGTSPFEPGSRDESYGVLLYVGAAPAGNPCPADLNGDGFVNSADLAALLGAWGPGSGAADLNGDGFVNSADLAALLGAWGPCQ